MTERDDRRMIPDEPTSVAGESADRTPPTRGVDRRTFLLWASGASVGATGVFLVVTGVQALMPPARSIDGMTDVGDVVVARVSDLRVGEPLFTDYGDDRIFVVRTSQDGIRVFDAACPHARCTLRFNRVAARFDCPCHRSAFTLRGERLRGPAQRDMIAARFEVVGDEIIVSGFKL